MQTKPLYVLVSDGGDGSYSVQYTLNPDLIKEMNEAYDDERMTYENGMGCDGDGFHYDTINVPADSTAKSLGITVIDDDYVKNLSKWNE